MIYAVVMSTSEGKFEPAISYDGQYYRLPVDVLPFSSEVVAMQVADTHVTAIKEQVEVYLAKHGFTASVKNLAEIDAR